MLRRWLDPPERRERKRLIRAGLLLRPEPAVTPVVIVAVPMGCLLPLTLGVILVGLIRGTRR